MTAGKKQALCTKKKEKHANFCVQAGANPLKTTSKKAA